MAIAPSHVAPTRAERPVVRAFARIDFGRWKARNGWLVSSVISGLFHLLVLVAAGWWLLPPPEHHVELALEASALRQLDPEVRILEVPPQANLIVEDVDRREAIALAVPILKLPEAAGSARPAPGPKSPDVAPAPLTLGELRAWNLTAATDTGPGGSGLAGSRSAAGRAAGISSGGSIESELAVDRGLAWIVEHQMGDGGWSFDHRTPACKGRCGNPGNYLPARVAATSLALLPLLGAGHTHKKGKHKKAVQGGLSFIGRSMRLGPEGGDLQAGGTMYSHGLATIALCEAYAMTQDRQLVPTAQAALNFISTAQDPLGGGWRYAPGMPGDTSVFGWQLMALKSGHLGYLQVPPRTIQGASHFLDTVQLDSGAMYGYTAGLDRKDGDKTTTAVGLLGRMYLGWKHDDPALVRGVELLGKWGPSDQDLYFDYYATQVMRHFGGEPWERWNERMRDRVVATQARKGHETGSWFIADSSSEVGGRLYCTAMSVMILEVYYRHLPLYKQRSTTDDF